jgi:hypothetical protein
MQPEKVTELKVIWRERAGRSARQAVEYNEHPQMFS